MAISSLKSRDLHGRRRRSVRTTFLGMGRAPSARASNAGCKAARAYPVLGETNKAFRSTIRAPITQLECNRIRTVRVDSRNRKRVEQPRAEADGEGDTLVSGPQPSGARTVVGIKG